MGRGGMWVAPPKGWSSRVFCELPALPRAERQVPKSQPGTEPRALWGPMPPSPLPQPLSLGGFDTMSQKSVLKGSRGQAGTQVTQSPAAEATWHPAGSWNFSQKRTPLRLDSPGSAAPCLRRDTQGGGRCPLPPLPDLMGYYSLETSVHQQSPHPRPPGVGTPRDAACSHLPRFSLPAPPKPEAPREQSPPERLRNAGTSPFPSGRRGPAGTWDRCAQRKDAAAQAHVPMGQVTKQAGGWPDSLASRRRCDREAHELRKPVAGGRGGQERGSASIPACLPGHPTQALVGNSRSSAGAGAKSPRRSPHAAGGEGSRRNAGSGRARPCRPRPRPSRGASLQHQRGSQSQGTLSPRALFSKAWKRLCSPPHCPGVRPKRAAGLGAGPPRVLQLD